MYRWGHIKCFRFDNACPDTSGGDRLEPLKEKLLVHLHCILLQEVVKCYLILHEPQLKMQKCNGVKVQQENGLMPLILKTLKFLEQI